MHEALLEILLVLLSQHARASIKGLPQGKGWRFFSKQGSFGRMLQGFCRILEDVDAPGEGVGRHPGIMQL